MKKRITIQEARSQIKHYCAKQERSHMAVRKKLKDYGIPNEAAEEIIAELISENFLNELRYALAFVSGKLRINQWGRNKIKMHLKAQHISDYASQKALDGIDQEEYLQILRKILRHKAQFTNGSAFEQRQKLFRFATQRGFESQSIIKILDEFIENNQS